MRPLKRSTILGLLILAALVVLFVLDRSDLRTEHVQWSSSGDKCTVSFYLANRSVRSRVVKVAVRANRLVSPSPGVPSRGARTPVTVGARIVDIEIAAHETKNLNEVFDVPCDSASARVQNGVDEDDV